MYQSVVSIREQIHFSGNAFKKWNIYMPKFQAKPWKEFREMFDGVALGRYFLMLFGNVSRKEYNFRVRTSQSILSRVK